jgi:hypothetical protein
MRFKDKHLWQVTGDESFRPTECDICGYGHVHAVENIYSHGRWTISDFEKFHEGVEDGCLSCVWLEKGISYEVLNNTELQSDIRVWASNLGRKILLVRFPWSPAILSFFTSPRLGSKLIPNLGQRGALADLHRVWRPNHPAVGLASGISHPWRYLVRREFRMGHSAAEIMHGKPLIMHFKSRFGIAHEGA